MSAPKTPASGEEALLKRQQDAVNELTHLMESYRNRLSFDTSRLSERYVDGRLDICVKLRSRNSGKELHLIVSRSGLESKSTVEVSRSKRLRSLTQRAASQQGQAVFEVLPVSEADPEHVPASNDQASHREAASHIERSNGQPVFFVNAQLVEGPQMRISSRLSIGLLNQFNGSVREELFYCLDGVTVGLFRFSEWKPDFIIRPSLPVREDSQNVVKRVTQRGNDVADFDPQVSWDIRDFESIDFFAALRINISDRSIWVARDKLLNVGLDFVSCGFGPFGLLIAPCKRMVFHDPRRFLDGD